MTVCLNLKEAFVCTKKHTVFATTTIAAPCCIACRGRVSNDKHAFSFLNKILYNLQPTCPSLQSFSLYLVIHRFSPELSTYYGYKLKKSNESLFRFAFIHNKGFFLHIIEQTESKIFRILEHNLIHGCRAYRPKKIQQICISH